MHRLSQAIGPPITNEAKGLHRLLSEISQKYPHQIAVASIHQPHDYLGVQSIPLSDDAYKQKPYLRWTFTQFQQATRRLVHGLLDFGVRQGTPVMTLISNGVEFLMLSWAAIQLGAFLVPVNPRNLSNVEEVRHMFNTGKSVATSLPSLIICQDIQIALKVRELGLAKDCKLIVCSEEIGIQEYMKFSDLLSDVSGSLEVKDNESHKETITTVLFSSGTTSLPKALAWTNTIWAHVLVFRRLASPMYSGDSVCLVVPNNHSLHSIFGLGALTQGASVVLPGPTFQPQLMLTTTRREKCTHTVVVPAMLRTLKMENATCGGNLLSLKSIALGGSVISPESLAHAQDDLGSKEVENAFGSTEGIYLLGGSHADRNSMIKDSYVAAGVALPGAMVKICAPDEFVPVPLGKLGELHLSGPTLTRGYIGKNTLEFYTDENGKRWYKSGDQAFMEPEGRVFITGRYKENIIRGGENISPAAIEAVVARDSRFADLNLQIIKVSDPVAGEVPIAVCGSKVDSDTAQQIQNVILSAMGPAFVPEEIIDIFTIGLQDFPKTMAGKIQKVKLANIVENYRTNSKTNSHNGMAQEHIGEMVMKIWIRTVGHDVDENAAITDFSDSITLMRVRDRILKELGYHVPLADLITAGTVGGQIEMIKSLRRRPNYQRVSQQRSKQRTKPLSANDIVVFKHQLTSESFEQAKQIMNQALASFGLNWNHDIQDIIPAQDFVRIHTQNGTINSWSWTFGILSTTASLEQMRGSVLKVFQNNPLLLSFFLYDKNALGEDLAFHVIPKLTQRLVDVCMANHGKVKTIADLKTMCQENLDLKHAKLPGPLTYAAFVEVEETQSTAVLLVIHHSVIDASSGQLIFEDLDRALGGQQLMPHIDYKIWADSYYSLRRSLDAQASVNWHVDQLSSIASHKKAIYPPATTSCLSSHQVLNRPTEDGIVHSFTVSDLLALRHQNPALTAPVILKTAWALFNVQRTGHTHALFANIEAARTRFPFVPEILDDLTSRGQSGSSSAFEATDVSGPLFQLVTNLFGIRPEETTLALLHRMQEHQNQLTRHASAPLGDILSALDATTSSSPSSGSVLPKPSTIVVDTVRTQVFNYLSTMANVDNSDTVSTGNNPYAHMQIVNGVVRPEIKLVVTAGLGASSPQVNNSDSCDNAASTPKSATVHDRFFLHIRSHVLSTAEMEGIAMEVEQLVRWLVNSNNWERPVKELRRDMQVWN